MEDFYKERVEYSEKVLKMILSKCGDKVDEFEFLVKGMNDSKVKTVATEFIDLFDMLIVALQDCKKAKNVLKEELEK